MITVAPTVIVALVPVQTLVPVFAGTDTAPGTMDAEMPVQTFVPAVAGMLVVGVMAADAPV